MSCEAHALEDCRGGELLREVAWVIFDEVHYMQDRERGVVWEESIIFLPHQAHMVMPHHWRAIPACMLIRSGREFN